MTNILSELLKVIPEYNNYSNYNNIKLNKLTLDSRAVEPHALFFAYKGHSLDGRNFIQQAIDNGAEVILYENYESYESNLENNISSKSIRAILLPVNNLNKYISKIASEFYNNPSLTQNIIAITGTNGKTTCSYLIAQLLLYLNKKTGIIGTLGYKNFDVPSDLFENNINQLNTTTPDPILVQKILSEFNSSNTNNIVLEASSHALCQHRLSGVNISTAVFTNLTQDHLDYHQNLEEYFLAKSKLFYFDSVKNIVVNIDDIYGRKLLEELINNKINKNKKIFVYFIDKDSLDYLNNLNKAGYKIGYIYCCKYIKNNFNYKLQLNLVDYINNINTELDCTYGMLGKFNISNLMASIASLYLNLNNIQLVSNLLNYCERLVGAPGRLEQYYSASKQVLLLVDYAHTPDALLQSLVTAKEYLVNSNNQIWCVFGCGGDRDKSKRSKMGNIAAQYADKIILTDDNPRTEDPNSIINDIKSGLGNHDQNNDHNKLVAIINNRKQAIETALNTAKAGDVILVAGKGHEDYQIYGKDKLPYDEREFVRKLVSS